MSKLLFFVSPSSDSCVKLSYSTTFSHLLSSSFRFQIDLLQREADYKRLNEELEAKTTSLFQETESMLRQQEEYLAAAAELETQGPDYYVDPRVAGDEDDGEHDFGFSQTLGMAK